MGCRMSSPVEGSLVVGSWRVDRAPVWEQAQVIHPVVMSRPQLVETNTRASSPRQATHGLTGRCCELVMRVLQLVEIVRGLVGEEAILAPAHSVEGGGEDPVARRRSA
jgi:hypothetical protein